MSLGEICNREVMIISRDESIPEAVKLMRDHHVGSVVVVEDSDGAKKPIGILTDRDIVIELIAEGVDINSVSVGDVMSYDLTHAKETDGIYDAIRTMRLKGIRRMPVIDQHGGLIGIITVDDLIDLIGEEMKNLADLIGSEQRREQASRP